MLLISARDVRASLAIYDRSQPLASRCNSFKRRHYQHVSMVTNIPI